MDLFNIIAGVCSILGLLIALFTYTKVVNIENQYNQNSSVGNIEQKGKKNKLSGRDINE